MSFGRRRLIHDLRRAYREPSRTNPSSSGGGGQGRVARPSQLNGTRGDEGGREAEIEGGGGLEAVGGVREREFRGERGEERVNGGGGGGHERLSFLEALLLSCSAASLSLLNGISGW